jgi:PKD domain
MSRLQRSARRVSTKRLLVSTFVAVVGAWSLTVVVRAHEHKHTHQNLARASFRFLNSPFLAGGLGEGNAHLTAQDIENEIVQGVMDEDECMTFDSTGSTHDWGNFPNWNSHFYEGKQGTQLDVPILFGGGACDFNVQWSPTHTNAANRARMLFNLAADDYRAGQYKSSFRILGRVMHLLEDMTSPAHVHDDPHGELPQLNDCGGDTDDFEVFGYCEGLAGFAAHKRICEYFHDADQTSGVDFACTPPARLNCQVDFDGNGQLESYGVPPVGFRCRLWAALQRLYGGKAQGSRRSSDPVTIRAGENAGFAFIRHVANITYDFTTFTTHLQDVSTSEDPQPPSELKAMLRGGGAFDCILTGGLDKGLCEATDANGWRIRGEFQNIGRSDAQGFRTERQIGDSNEEWWLMPTSYFFKREFRLGGGFDVFIDGFAYIENSGGEGPLGGGDEDSFIPLRYGCTAADVVEFDGRLCSENFVGPKSKAKFQQLYGRVTNNREDPFRPVTSHGKTMLTIYGDVLYTTAVAYGAGLIQAFLDEVTVPPTANAGGPYQGEACTPITFDGSGSSDANGTITSYSWDFTDNGTFDATTSAAQYSYAYAMPFKGEARLRVTDNDGFTDEATAAVVVTPDVTPPVITKITATPNQLWPPNHKMKPVTIDVSLAGACADTCRITGVTSSEAQNTRGNHQPDWVVTGRLTLQLMAERSGNVDQRLYTVAIACVDAAGNETTGNVTVVVPHDKGRQIERR